MPNAKPPHTRKKVGSKPPSSVSNFLPSFTTLRAKKPPTSVGTARTKIRAPKDDHHGALLASFGSSLRLLHEDRILAEFHGYFTRDTLRVFLSTICVPQLHIGRTRFVDSISFYLAMRCILRLGEPDFIAIPPPDNKIPRNNRTALTPAYLHSQLETLYHELLYNRTLQKTEISEATYFSTARDAATRLQR